MKFKKVKMDLKQLMEIEKNGEIVYSGVDDFVDWNGEVIVMKDAMTVTVFVVEEGVDESFDVLIVRCGGLMSDEVHDVW